MNEVYVKYYDAREVAVELARPERYSQCERLGYSYVHVADPSTISDEEDVRILSEDQYAAGCYVGGVLHAMGAHLTDLVKVGGSLNNARKRFARVGVYFTDRAFKFLDVLQSMQDNSHTWQEALNIAETLANRWHDELDDIRFNKDADDPDLF